ncbi:hypothetical protein HJFPF1_06796 [Paramyrothecium foliicola]|nr:hypothetical protein HJFPF1_06796 [Paramyrothecium foliicola]
MVCESCRRANTFCNWGDRYYATSPALRLVQRRLIACADRGRHIEAHGNSGVQGTEASLPVMTAEFNRLVDDWECALKAAIFANIQPTLAPAGNMAAIVLAVLGGMRHGMSKAGGGKSPIKRMECWEGITSKWHSFSDGSDVPMHIVDANDKGKLRRNGEYGVLAVEDILEPDGHVDCNVGKDELDNEAGSEGFNTSVGIDEVQDLEILGFALWVLLCIVGRKNNIKESKEGRELVDMAFTLAGAPSSLHGTLKPLLKENIAKFLTVVNDKERFSAIKLIRQAIKPYIDGDKETFEWPSIVLPIN